jgi:kynurenine formamidase
MGGIAMRRLGTVMSALVVATVVTGSGGAYAWAQMMTPVGPQWWPSRWGANDEAGASNWMTPEKVVEAVKLIKTGKVYRVGRVYEAGMPLRGQRTYKLTIPTVPTGGPFGTNKLIFNDEFVTSEIGQVGTQFDGLGHIGVLVGNEGDQKAMRFYNGVTAAEISSPYGLKRLGIEKLKPIFTRGVLLDIAAHKGRMLDKGEEITIADLQGAMSKQGLTDLRQGDAVLINTGWGMLWMKDNARFDGGAPGIGLEAAKWLAGKQVALVGSDTWPVEVNPNPDPNVRGIVHQELIAKNGIFLHENLDFSELIRDRAYEFAYIFVPVPLKGATGSPGSPIAVR